MPLPLAVDCEVLLDHNVNHTFIFRPAKSGDADLPPPKPLSKKSPKAAQSGSSGIPTIKKSLSWRALNQLKLSKKPSVGKGESAG